MDESKNLKQKDKEKFVHQVFEDIAPEYDRMNSILSFRTHKAWRKFSMKKLAVQSGQSALDVCCGTCDWTISLVQAVGPFGKVTGLDFSENMLQIGQQKINRSNVGQQIELIKGNAMSLPFDDSIFDVVTIGFALRNVPDLQAVLEEMKRVVKPNGKVVSLELSRPTWPLFRTIYLLYFKNILPFISKILIGKYDQYKWLPESLEGFPDYKQLEQMMLEIGFQKVETYPLTGGIAALHIGVK